MESNNSDDLSAHEIVPDHNATLPVSITGRCRKKVNTTSYVYNYFCDNEDSSEYMSCAVDGCGRSFSKGMLAITPGFYLNIKRNLTKKGAVLSQAVQRACSSHGEQFTLRNKIDEEKRSRLFAKVVNWIVDSKLVIFVVKNICFKEFLKESIPCYDLPSCRYIAKGIGDEYSEK